MDFVSLSVQKRDVSLPAKNLRKENLIPAEFYGEGEKNFSLQMDYQFFRKAYKQAGRNTIVQLKIEGEEKGFNVLVHEVQKDPITCAIRHVDFINVQMDKVVYTSVPLEFVGEASAVKDLGGTLMTNLTEIEVKCLPKDLIHSIKVDISNLADFHSSIHVKDLNVPATVTVETDLESMVATVTPPKAEEEPESVAVATDETAETAKEEDKKEGENK